jgi:nitroreductase
MDPRDRTFSEVHRTRRSVVEYTGEVVSRDLVTAIVEEATQAPSAFNSQPWRVVVVRDDELQRVLPAMGGNASKVREAGTLVAVFADLRLEGRAAGFYDGSPARTPVEYGVRNGSLLAMALMDAAWSHGVGTRPMIGFDAAALGRSLDVPDSWHPVLTMALGWPLESDPEPGDRRPVGEVLTILG